MPEQIRLGLVGLTHDHIWDHLPDVLASARIDLRVAAEANPTLREQLAEHTDCPTVGTWQESSRAATSTRSIFTRTTVQDPKLRLRPSNRASMS